MLAITWALSLTIEAHPVRERIVRRLQRPNLAAPIAIAIIAVIVIALGMLLAQSFVNQVSRGGEILKTQTESGQWQSALESSPQSAGALGWIEPRVVVMKAVDSAA